MTAVAVRRTMHTTARPIQSKTMPMRNLPAINKKPSTEAQQARHSYQPPEFVMGEPCFYRPYRAGHEMLGFVMRMQNKSFTVIACEPNGVFKEFNSVDYYDHTEEDPWATGDPMAGNHAYGTLRKTEFGKVVLQALAGTLGGSVPDTRPGTADIKGLQDIIIGLDTELQQLKAEVDKLKGNNKPKMEAPKAQQPQQPAK